MRVIRWVRNNALASALIAFISFTLGGIWSGVIAYWVNVDLPTIGDDLQVSTTVRKWILLVGIVGFFCLGAVAGALVLRAVTIKRTQQEYQLAFAKMQELIKLDDSLLRLLARLTLGSNYETRIKRLLREFLMDATRLFATQVNRAYILRVDPNDQQSLAPWVDYQMSRESLERTRFYIGQDADKPRGVAGEAYIQHRILVCRFDRNGQPDSQCYVVFDARRPKPPYESLVAVPIMSPDNVCVGVLCFDSVQRETFDSAEVQEMLSSLAGRLGSALVVYHQVLDSVRSMAAVASPTETNPSLQQKAQGRLTYQDHGKAADSDRRQPRRQS